MKRKISLLVAVVMAMTMTLGMSVSAFAIDTPVHHFDISVQSITSDDFGNNLPTNNYSISPEGMKASLVIYKMFDSNKDLKYLAVFNDPTWIYFDIDTEPVDSPDFSDIVYVTEMISCYVNHNDNDFASDVTVKCNGRDLQPATIGIEDDKYAEGFMIFNNGHGVNKEVEVSVEVYNGSNAGPNPPTPEPSPTSPAHVHNFRWQTISAPTSYTDGLEAEVCSICGERRNEQPLSAYGYALNQYATPMINSAQPGQTVIFEFGEWNSFPKSFMEKIAAKNDVTYVFKFKYNHLSYTVCIPAGTKVDLNEDWYGPLKLAELYGAIVE